MAAWLSPLRGPEGCYGAGASWVSAALSSKCLIAVAQVGLYSLNSIKTKCSQKPLIALPRGT